ncbi:MAG: D-alanyl-D-alanine carboxypeptidase [Ruminococcus sp.]|nr:D-alanyl-D-alanine carboxypeptidase [Ruminococcus sp.]
MKRLICMMICLIFGCRLFAASAQAEEPQPEAAAYVLMECSTGAVLEEQNGSMPLPVGTMAKLMTALLAGEMLASGQWQKDTILTASDCVNDVKGAVIWLLPGETMTVDNLLKGLIIGNAGDAAAVLAENISGSQTDFVMDMNARAFDLGMHNTVFTTPQGYDDERAYSTACDIGLLCCALSELECLLPYFTTWRDFLRDGATELVNENTFARTYEGMIGWKAGHSEAAGWCIAAGAEKDGMQCAAVILGSPDEDSRFALARTLLRKGFSQYQVTLPGYSSEFMKPVAVRGGIAQYVETEAASLQGLVVPRSDPALTTVLVLPDYIRAPVEKGRCIGVAAFYNGDTLLLETPLVAKESVAEMTIGEAIRKIVVKMCKL